MSDTRKEFENFIFGEVGQSLLNGIYDRTIGGEHLAYQVWQECQRVNDARINTLNDAISEDKILESHNRDLLAANQVLREALQFYADAEHKVEISPWLEKDGWREELRKKGFWHYFTDNNDVETWIETGQKADEAISIQNKSNTE